MLKIRGIPIKFHLAWYVAIVLISLSLASSFFPSRYPDISKGALWTMSIGTALFIYLSVLLHELAHAIVAQRAGMTVKKITMHFFGGLAEIDQEFKDYGTEFKVAMAGPLLSLALFIGLSLFYKSSVICLYLATINLILICFNMTPVFPLDGGRILRAILWRAYGDMLRATETAVVIAARLTYGIMALGLFLVIKQNYNWGIWLLILGFYLLTINRGIYKQVKGIDSLEGSIHDVMVPVEKVIMVLSTDLPLSDFYRQYCVIYGLPVYPVCVNNHNIAGYVAVDGKSIALGEGVKSAEGATIADVMISVPEEDSVTPHSKLREAFEKMFFTRKNYVFVCEGNRLCGILWRDAIVRSRAALDPVTGKIVDAVS